MKKSGTGVGTASGKIDARIEELGDWRGERLARIRALIKEAIPDIVEEWKWMGTPCFEHNGLICTGETYRDKVKITFAKGASLADPSKLFNSSLDGNVRRAIDYAEKDKLNEKALKALLQAADALNSSKASAKKAPAKKAPAKKAPTRRAAVKKAPAKKPAPKKAAAKR